MSTLNITDLLRELQAGEEARAKIPQLESTVAEYRKLSDDWAKHNQALELSILGYKSTISDLTTKVARLEVERDDAGFRELETQDKLNTLLSDVRGLRAHLGDAIDHVLPPAPEPVSQPIVSDASVSMKDDGAYTGDPRLAQSVPITDHGAERVADPVTTAQDALTKAAVDYKTATYALGQSEADPTSAPTMDTQQSAAVTSSGAEPTANVSADHSSANPQAYRPFGGDAVGPRPYHEKPDTTPWADWIAAGNEKPYWL